MRRDYIRFGSFNNLAKVNSAVIDLWLRVLAAVPRSRLLLSWPTLADPNERARLASAFSGRGLDPCRLELRRGAREHAGVLGEYSEVDIALDPFPFSGCLTTCEALWMGLPVVTWPHSRPVSRQSQAFLTALGRTEWVAWDADSPVGYLLAVFVFSLENGGLTAEIDEFFVLESHRGRGIGVHLLATCERYLSEAGCTNVALQLARGNDAAREFYRRNGYAPRNGYELLEKDLWLQG